MEENRKNLWITEEEEGGGFFAPGLKAVPYRHYHNSLLWHVIVIDADVGLDSLRVMARSAEVAAVRALEHFSKRIKERITKEEEAIKKQAETKQRNKEERLAQKALQDAQTQGGSALKQKHAPAKQGKSKKPRKRPKKAISEVA